MYIRKNLLLIGIVGLWIVLGSLTGCGTNNQQEEATSPNIIFILADDLGYNELGCYGQEIIKTPNIDRLATEGIRLAQHYSGSPVCAPSRCVLLSGKHTGHSYVRNNFEVEGGDGFWGQKPLADSTITIAELLKLKGYATAAMGKWGLGKTGSEGDPNNQGFDLFFGFNCQRHAHNHYPKFLIKNQDTIWLAGNTRELSGEQHSQDLFIEEALKFIKNNETSPFFLYLPFAIPHLSIQVPYESLEEYKEIIEEEDYTHMDNYLQHPFPRAGYAAMITHMDKGIGQIMALLEEVNIEDNTLIIFTSDNGPTYDRIGGADSEFFKSAGAFRGLKGSVYEGGIRVPFVARWPGKIKPGTINEHICAFQDILPTLSEVAGVSDKNPDDIDGISFVPTLLDKNNQAEHEYLYMEFASYGGQQMVRMGDWKGVKQNMFKDSLQIELYNLSDDIGEQNDISGQHPEVVEQILEIMKEARIPSKDFPFKQIDP